MICIKDSSFSFEEKTIVTFGKFDGIHKGHRKLIEEAKRISKETGFKVVAFTFKVQDGYHYDYMDNLMISTPKERERIFEALGVDILVEYPFNDMVAGLEPLEFLEKIVKDKLSAAYVVVGEDWTFGCKGAGNCNLLKASQKLYDFSAVVLEKEKYEDNIISSTLIREQISLGKMETVMILLDYPYTVSGRVVHGNELGRTINVPTVNIMIPEGKILPPYGVYAATVLIDGKEYFGVSNLGIKPTVGADNEPLLETHILDFDEDVYGKEIEVHLVHFQRPEMKFQNFEALHTQLMRDIDFTKSYFLLDLFS